jgi:YtcA family
MHRWARAVHQSRVGRAAWAALLSGCSQSPSTNVLGAYFPAWLFCIVGAVVAAVLIRLVLLHVGLEEWLAPPAIAYPALVALLAFAGWLLFY